MTNSQKTPSGLFAPLACRHLLWLALAGPLAAAAADSASLTGQLRAVEGTPHFEISWLPLPDALYRVQVSADPAGGSNAWSTIDAIPSGSSPTGPLRWMAPEAVRERAFYRLDGPNPEIFGVEPALVDSSDASAVLHLLGQRFPSNVLVEVNGMILTPSSVNASGTELRVSLNGLPPGQPILGAIRILNPANSNLITAWTVQSPLVYGTELTTEQLQGPPAEPPASPQALLALWASRKGYEYYKARSDLNAAGLHSNPMYAENNNQGTMPLHDAYLSKKGYDYYQAQSQLNSAARGKGNAGHGTILKAFDDGDDAATHKRAGKNKPLRVICERGQVNDPASRLGDGGPDDDCDGVFAATGEFRIQEADLVIPGRGLDFAWVRTYRSRTGPTTAQGAGWDFSYNASLTPQPDGSVVLRTGDGRANTFYRDGTNGWLRDEYFTTIGDLDGDSIPDVAVFPDTGKWVFHPPGTAAGGKLWRIADRNGNTLTLDYDLKGFLTGIVDDLGRTNTVAYDGSGRIASVTDFSGRVVRYEYDGHGDLVACISPSVIGTPLGNDFPDGKTNRYAYTSGFADDRLNHNLTACIDAKGQTWLQVGYQPTNNPASIDFDAVAYTQRGVDKKDIKRGMVIARQSNSFATVKAILRDAVGNVTECYYDSRQRCVRQLEYTGRSNPALPVTETDNRPTGKLRADDPDYFETRWEWNPDSLCTREIRPGGDSTEIVHQRAQDHNSVRSNKTASRKHDGDVRVLRERASGEGGDLDGDGAPDITELAWYFEYDPRFGSPPSRAQDHNSTRSNKTGSVLDGGGGSTLGDLAAFRARRKGWDGLIYGNHRAAFGGESTPIIKGSALGDLAAGRHRHKGWDGLIYGNHRAPNKSPSGVTHEYHRFATSITDPRGNVTTATYDASGNRKEIRKDISITLRPDTNVHHFVHNAHGQLTAITNAPDANGLRRVDTFSYHASGPQAGYLASIAIDEPGVHLTTAFEYDARGNVTRVVDPRGNDWLYTYNTLDQLVRMQSPTNVAVRCETTHLLYDANDNVVQSVSELRDETDAFVRNVSSIAEYDLFDRCVAVADQVSPGVFATNRFEYDGNGQLTAALSPLAVSGADPHNQVAFEYDERGLLFRETGAPGSGNSPTNEFSYEANGRLRSGVIAEVGAGRPATVGRYDGFGRLTSVTDPMGNVVACVYDRNGNLTRVRSFGETNDVPGNAGNRLLAETRYSYDSLDRCVQQVDSFFDIFTGLPVGDGQSVTTFSYAPNGARTAVTDDNGHTTRYAYDTVGRCAQITDSKTNIVQFTYDGCGNLTGMTSIERPDGAGAEQQFSRIYTYDALGRCVQTADNVGNTTVGAYDSLGRVVLQTDARANDAVFVHDDLGRCLTTVHYAGARKGGITINTTHVEYDTKGRVLASTDANTNTTAYAYDSLDRCVQVTAADGTRRTMVWSPRSNLVAEEDAHGTTITNTYDLCDRIIHRDIAARGGAAGTTTFETFAYDGLSRRVSAANDSSIATFAFDSLGNCVRSTQDGLSATSTYDGVGNCTSMTYPSGGTVTCAYDSLGQLTSISRSAGGGLPPVTLASYAYDGPGRLARVTRGNGVETRLQWDGKVNPPNAAGDFGWGQVSGVSHQEAAGARAVLDRRVFAYDRNQNKIERAQTVPFYPGGATTTNRFAYDALNRLTQFTRETGGADDFLRVYGLDPNGNRLFAASNGVAAPYIMDATLPAPADFQMSQYTVTPFGNQTYDENGNLRGRTSSAAVLQYVHDHADRLVAVNDFTTGAPRTIVIYGYDAMGRRIGKTLFPAGGLPPVTTRFVYSGEDCDDADPIEEHENGSLQRTHIIPHTFESKGGGLAAKTFVIPHVFEHKGRILILAGGSTLHLHPDDLGNTLALTDDKGAVIERYDYDDFGVPAILTSDGLPTGETSSGVGNPILFRALEWDAETGFYHTGGGGGFDPQTAKDINGGMPNRISMNVTVPKQTQGATFGERVNAGLHAAGSALAQGASLLRHNPWSLKKEEGGRHTPFHNRRYNYHEAWPCRWKAPELNSSVSLIVPVVMDKGLRFAGVRR